MKASHMVFLSALSGFLGVPVVLLSVSIAAQQPKGDHANAKEDSPANTQYAWNLRDVEDRMKNQHRVEGYLVQHPKPGSAEQLQVGASCDDSGMHWLIAYRSGTRPATGLQQNIPPGKVNSPRIFIPEAADTGMALSMIAGQTVGGLMSGVANAMRPTGPWVHLQLRIDKHEQVDIVSVENYANVAGIRFDLPVSLTAKTKDDAEMAHALKVLTPGQYRAPATILDIQHAQTVLVSLPREDGSVMYLEVHPQEPNFKKFAQACLVSLAGQMNSLMKESVLPAGGGGGINNPDFAEPTLPLQHPANFEGDLAEFDKILPQLIERAALKWKMPLHSLDAEATLISRNAAQCSSLTPQVVAALSPEDRSQLEQGRSYPKWQACEGGFVPVSRLIRQYDPKTERGVLYTIKPVGGWENARAVEMKIQLTGLPGDGVLGNLFDYYGVVDAKIRVASNGQPNPSAAIPARPYVVASGPSTGGSPPSSSRAAIPEAIPGGYSGPTAPSSTATGGKSPVDSHTGRVTRALPSINGHAQLTAPGRGNHSYNVFYIDTRDFAQGGELDLMIQVDKNSRTSGSFELFAGETRFSATGGSTRPLAGKYDVPPGERIHLKYRFSAGQVFALGAEGNWFSPKGVTGDVIFQASVH